MIIKYKRQVNKRDGEYHPYFVWFPSFFHNTKNENLPNSFVWLSTIERCMTDTGWDYRI